MKSPRILTDRLRQITVLFEDDHLLAVCKPPGIAVHGGAAEKKKTVLDVLGEAYEGQKRELVLAHRLDRDTSGVLLLTKDPDMALKLRADWHLAEKVYWAVALGTIKRAMRIDQPLEDKDGRVRDAATRILPQAQLDKVEPHSTLVEAHLETGRTHQIRRHLASKGHPVLGDDKHGNFAANKAWDKAIRAAGGPRPKHMMLHARRLSIRHPISGETLEFHAPAPDSWVGILQAAGASVDETGRLS